MGDIDLDETKSDATNQHEEAILVKVHRVRAPLLRPLRPLLLDLPPN